MLYTYELYDFPYGQVRVVVPIRDASANKLPIYILSRYFFFSFFLLLFNSKSSKRVQIKHNVFRIVVQLMQYNNSFRVIRI